VHHVEEVRRQRQIGARRDRLLAGAQPRVGGDDCRKPRREQLGRRHVGGRGNVVGMGEVERQRRARHAQRVDGRRPRRRAHYAHRLFGERAQLGDFLAQCRQLVPRRQCAAPQQMRRCFERDTARQLLELVAADDQLTGLTVDVTEACLGGDDAVQASRCGGWAHGHWRRGDAAAW